MPLVGPSRLHQFLYRHWLLTFGVMTLAFMTSGLLSLQLVNYAMANLSLIGEHGVQALMDGALQQFLELSFKAVCTVFSYLVFKACESVLVQRLFTAQKDPS